MPTAAEYEEYASDFDRFQERTTDKLLFIARHRSTPGVGGTFGGLVGLSIDSFNTRFDAAHDDLGAAADECLRRMAICEDYEREVRMYERELAEWRRERDNFDPSDPMAIPPGIRPIEPTPPYAWVEI